MTTILPGKALARKLRIAEATNNLIVAQVSEFNDFWNRPVDAILQELNGNLQEALAMFEGNTMLGNALNSTQDTLNVIDEYGNPVYPARAPVTPGRSDISFNGTEFVYTPAIEETPVD